MEIGFAVVRVSVHDFCQGSAFPKASGKLCRRQLQPLLPINDRLMNPDLLCAGNIPRCVSYWAENMRGVEQPEDCELVFRFGICPRGDKCEV